ncbi:hypothetical protein FRC12_008266 [Ceratobasidium sp. 428]|nr:hypothetical protein FRC12_008266 [Ceratobasidium sp. 428]
MRPRYCSILLALGTLCHAWRAEFSEATQCGDMTVKWAGTGGEKLGPPFVARLAAFGLAPLTINIPETAWNDAKQSGSYSFNIPWPTNTKFVAAMDDGFGDGSGGVTGIQSVQSSSNSGCLTNAVTQPEHVFDVFGTYIQCSVVTMNWTQPATSTTRITGLVPNGIPFRLNAPTVNTKSTTWNLNIPGGTAFVLMYIPSSGPSLTSQLLVSQAQGGNDACMGSGAYPSATAPQTGVAEATSATSPTSPATNATGSGTPKLGPIIGATIGAVAFLCALLGLGFFFYRRKHSFARVRPESPGLDKEMNLETDTSHLDSAHGNDPEQYRNLPEGAVASPFVLPSVTSTQETPLSSNRKTTLPSSARSPTSQSPTARRMSRETLTSAESSHGAPGTSSARRDQSETTEESEPVFIQHADGGSVPIQPRPREVIELPPNYDQVPRPLPRPGYSGRAGSGNQAQGEGRKV